MGLETIVLIEDEASIADMVLYALKSEGFSAQWFRLGGEGLAWLKAHPDQAALLILDVGLPDGNGFEFCKAIRRFSELPIIFLTARNEEVDRIVGLEIGGDDYMGKPFSPRELTARVKTILKRTRSGSAAPDETATFEIDGDRHRIRYRDTWLDLTRYEYEVLRMLLGHPERIYSRAQIMDRVWMEPDESLERAVDTHIKTLRAKLRQVSAQDNPIRTHRGLGYSVSGSVRES